MKYQSFPSSSAPLQKNNFNAAHPMFSYEVAAVPSAIKSLMSSYDTFVVVGLGGSVLPLKAFVDAYQLQDRILFLDTVDSDLWRKYAQLPRCLFCVASKSGETLEIKALLAELVSAQKLSQMLIVTDPSKGWLRGWATANNLPTLEIPSDIGGRFTNFTIFHRALLERFNIPFNKLLERAKKTSLELKKDPSNLEVLYQQIFEGQRTKLILWMYGDSLIGLGQWIQQAIAESLGKITKTGKRVGVMPIVLKGPQDQHSVLQLLRDGPQDASIWFFSKKGNQTVNKRNLNNGLESFKSLGLQDAMEILLEATFQSFVERLDDPAVAQPLTKFELSSDVEDIADIVALIQALVEYSGDRLGITPFDQPGVERGKQISRDLISKRISETA